MPLTAITMMPERYIMVLLCALCCFINYADRVNMSVAIIAIGDEYKYTIQRQGVIMSYFFFGYLPMQIGGAVLCRRFGGKRVLSTGAILWSLFTFLTPIACALGYYPLLVCRFFMGLSEGVAFPAVFHFLSGWVPAKERGRSISFFLTGVHAGTTFALVVSPLIIKWHSWQFIFYSFGAAGFVWIVAWNILAYDRDVRKTGSGPNESRPNEAPVLSVSPELRDDDVVLLGDKITSSNSEFVDVRIDASLDSGPASFPPGVKQQIPATFGYMSQFVSPAELKSIAFILTNRRCMAVCITQAMFGFIHYTILSWLPSYFKNVFDAEATSLSFTFVPYLGMAVFANVGGLGADWLLHKGISPSKSRKIVTVVANIGASLSLALFAFAQSVPGALIYITLSMSCMSLNSGGFESTFLDMAEPSLVGTFKAVANTLGSFAGLVAIPFSTLVLRLANDSWRVMFGSLIFWYGVATVVFCGFSSSERVLVEDVGR